MFLVNVFSQQQRRKQIQAIKPNLVAHDYQILWKQKKKAGWWVFVCLFILCGSVWRLYTTDISDHIPSVWLKERLVVYVLQIQITHILDVVSKAYVTPMCLHKLQHTLFPDLWVLYASQSRFPWHTKTCAFSQMFVCYCTSTGDEWPSSVIYTTSLHIWKSIYGSNWAYSFLSLPLLTLWAVDPCVGLLMVSSLILSHCLVIPNYFCIFH